MKSPKSNAAYKFIISCVCLLVINIGCATLYGQNTREITITTVPSGADVYTHGVFFGKTPAKMFLPNPGVSGQVINVMKPGYYEQGFVVYTKFQPVAYWDILFPPGFLIDLGSGCLFSLKQDEYNVVLTKIESVTTQPMQR